MTSTTLRGLNLTNTPLLANQTFFGGYEYTGALLSGVVNCYASTNTRVVIIQNPDNIDTTYDVIVSQTDIAPYTLKNIDFILTLPYTKLVVTNLDAINQLQLDIIPVYTNLTYDVNIPTTVTGTVDIGNTVDVVVTNDVSCNILNVVDVSGSVVVTSMPAITGSVSSTITTNPVIVKEKPSYTVNLDALDTTSQLIRSSAGCLSGICLSHVGGSQFCYAKIYNSSTATSSDTPLATFAIYKDTTLIIDTHAMNFSGGLCVRGTDNYGSADNTTPSGSLKMIAFVTGYSE